VETVDVVSRSAAETEQIAAEVAGALAPGDVVLLAGDVGTGKTTFVRGACRALEVTDAVTSPSFTIGQRYRGRVPVAHIDLFRLETLEGEDPALLADYLTPEAVAFVEWPEAAAPELEPENVALRVRLEHLGEDRRALHASGRRELAERLRGARAEPPAR
jgi:tRNA threonylcarbamoyladenosine biosynthesis protein TsaE